MAGEQQDQPDRNVPSAERQAELEAAYEQRKDTEAPYEGVTIRTMGELQWIAQQRKWPDKPRFWSGELITPEKFWANLCKSNLSDANLSDAYLGIVNLQGACLNRANLHGVNLDGSDLSEASLRNTNLSMAHLYGTNLRQANLTEANLSKAFLTKVQLSGANLSKSHLDGAYFVCHQGRPIWPDLDEQEQRVILRSVLDPTMTAELLDFIVWQWPWLMFQEAIVANPNTPATTLAQLALQVPAGFLRNPALPLLFLENPHWLAPGDAKDILDALPHHHMALSAADTAIVRLIEQCAQVNQ